MVTVNGYAENYESITEPYIYSNYSILQTTPGVSEKVFVSLYGGDASDIDGYSWTIDNSSVATIQPTGQYCIISAKIQVMQESRLRIIKPPTLTTSVFMFLRMLQTSAISQLQTTSLL